MGKSPSILGKGGAADPQPFPAPYRKATDMDDTAVKNALDASPAPRVTEDKLAAVIMGETFAHRLTGTLTICVLTLANGFTVVGQSACASPENYREDLGEHYAREDAKRKVWPLEAYLLRERLHVAATFESEPKLDGMTMYVGNKALLARPMTRGEYCEYRGWNVPTDEQADDLGQVVQYSDGYISWSPQPQFDAAYTSVNVNRPAAKPSPEKDNRTLGNAPTPGGTDTLIGCAGNSSYMDESRRREALSYATHTCAATAQGDALAVLEVARRYDAFLRGDETK